MNRDKKERVLLFLILSLIIAVIAVRMFYLPLIRDNMELRTQLNVIRGQIDEAKIKSEDLARLRVEYEAIVERINKMNSSVLSGDNLKLIRRVCDMAKESGVLVNELKPVSESENSLSKDINYSMHFYSSFPDLFHFLKKCELNLPLNFAVDGIKMDAGKQGISGRVRMTLSTLKE